MAELGWQAGVTLGVVVVLVAALVREWARPDFVLLGGLGLLLAAGVVSPEQAFSGFANSAVLTVGALFVVAAGVQRTGALGFLDRALLTRPKRGVQTLPRLMATTGLLSAFLNNTAIVAMLSPRVQAWAERHDVPVSKLLIPLSYAAILGGMCTLIGTSTNIIVSGLLEAEGYPALGLFDLTWVGLPALVIVVAYFATVGHRLLPARPQKGAAFEDGLAECLFELRVAPGSPLIGRSTAESGLRALGSAYLAHVRRQGHLIPASPREVLQVGDVLAFVGSTAALDRLLEVPGLERAVPALAEDAYQTLPLYEAVVAPSSRLVGRTLRDVSFRENYHGVVLGIQRKDERITEPLGRTPIKAGDLLLVEAWNGFDHRFNASREEFYLVAPRRQEQKKALTSRTPVALFILGTMVAAFAPGWVPLVTAAFVAALAMIVTRCLPGGEARSAVDVSLLVTIAAALGIARAVESSGLAAAVAYVVTGSALGQGPVAVLAALYLTTNLLTEFLTNNAAAVLMLPIGIAAAEMLGLPPEAFAVTVAIAASASFLTPIGYQTNLMVMTVGGYRFTDYTQAGWPVTIIVMIVTLVVVSLVWLP